MASRNLYDKAAAKEIQDRLEKFTANAARKWGSMSAGQMLKHMNTAYAVALGKQKLKPAQPLAMLAGNPLGRWLMIDILEWPKSTPTAPEFIVKEEADFETEKSNLQGNIHAFLATDPSAQGEHPIFGKMDKATWGKLMYKHTDHHLRQFGC